MAAPPPATEDGGHEDDGHVTLWTYQVDSAWDVLCTRGALYGDAAEALPSDEVFASFERGYEWIAAAMHGRRRQGSTPVAVSGHYPVWAWLTRHIEPQEEPSVLIQFTVPRSRVLLTRFAEWDACVTAGRPVEGLADPGGTPLGGGMLEASWDRIVVPWEDVDAGSVPLGDLQATVEGVFLHNVDCVHVVPHPDNVPNVADPGPWDELPLDEMVVEARAAAAAEAAQVAVVERKMANALVSHSLVEDASAQIRAACYQYMVEREQVTQGERALGEALAATATPLDLPYSGRLGTDLEVLEAFWSGQHPGSNTVRAALTHFHCFITRVLAPDLVGPDALSGDVRSELAERCGWNGALLDALLDASAEAVESRLGSDATLAAVEMGRLSWHPFCPVQDDMRVATGIKDTDDSAWSKMSIKDFEVLWGGRVAPWEIRAAGDGGSPRGHGLLPWLDATLLFGLNEANEIVRGGLDTGTPLTTGLSGCTLRYMIFGGLVAPQVSPAALRAACLAFLVPTQAHTFYEVLGAAAAAAPGPLARSLSQGYAGLFPVDGMLPIQQLADDEDAAVGAEATAFERAEQAHAEWTALLREMGVTAVPGGEHLERMSAFNGERWAHPYVQLRAS